jgi:uncharacterized protein
MLPKVEWQEFFIPVHGLIRLRREEVTVLDHPAMQRLGDIYQLGQVHLVYRGATHRRLEHVLGTVHVAQLIIENLRRSNNPQSGRPDQGPWVLDDPINDVEEAFIRLGALLHDVGHLPAGHTLEDELGLLPAHDSASRLDLIFKKTTWNGTRVDALQCIIDSTYKSHAVATRLGKSASELVLDLITKQQEPASLPVHSTETFRLAICRDIIGNTICADLLDYLHRDWHHVGKPRYFDVRLLEYMEIRRTAGTCSAKPQSVVAVNLRSRDAVRTDAVTLILDLLESRYQLSEVALFHRTKLNAAAMLERAIAEVVDATPAPKRANLEDELVERLLDCSDPEMLSYLDERAKSLMTARTSQSTSARLMAVSALIRGLRTRQLHKRLFSQFNHQLSSDAGRIKNLYAPDPHDRAARANNRLRAVRLLEEDFGLEPTSIVMYCPPPAMTTKIAEVRILIDGSVAKLDDYERENGGDRGLTGGHLEAQKNRFWRLWRIHFAIREDVRRALEVEGSLITLQRAIDCVVLGRTIGDTTLEDAAKSVATELSAHPRSPLYGRTIIAASSAARTSSWPAYPIGVPTLRAFAS